MKPRGFEVIASMVMTGQFASCVLAASGFAVIGVTASLALNAVGTQSVAEPTQSATTYSDMSLISAPIPLSLPAEPTPLPEPIAITAPVPKALQVPKPAPVAPAQVTVIAVTPQIKAPEVESCVTQLAAFVEGKILNFPTASATLTSEEKDVLKLIGTQAQACPDALIQVEGHTDSVGPDALNLKLSWKRAENTLAALTALGIDTQQFEPVGYGARAPMTQGDASEEHLNRRVEFTVLKRAEPDA